MLCVICISRGGSASVSFSEVEERAVDLRNVSTISSKCEPSGDVGQILMQDNMRIELTWTLFAEPKMEFDQLALKSKPLPVFDPPDPVPSQSCCTTL